MQYQNQGQKYDLDYAYHSYAELEGRVRETGFLVTGANKVLVRAHGLGHSGSLSLLVADGNATYQDDMEGGYLGQVVDALDESIDLTPDYHYVPGSYERGDSHYFTVDLPAGTLFGFEAYSAEGTGKVEVVNPSLGGILVLPPGTIELPPDFVAGA